MSRMEKDDLLDDFSELLEEYWEQEGKSAVKSYLEAKVDTIFDDFLKKSSGPIDAHVDIVVNILRDELNAKLRDISTTITTQIDELERSWQTRLHSLPDMVKAHCRDLADTALNEVSRKMMRDVGYKVHLLEQEVFDVPLSQSQGKDGKQS